MTMPVNVGQLQYLLNALKDLRPLVTAFPADVELKALQDEMIAQIKQTRTPDEK